MKDAPHSLISPQDRDRRRQLRVRPILSQGTIDEIKHVNTHARVCACQLRLHLFCCREALLLIIQGNGKEWSPHIQAVIVPSVSQPPAA